MAGIHDPRYDVSTAVSTHYLLTIYTLSMHYLYTIYKLYTLTLHKIYKLPNPWAGIPDVFTAVTHISRLLAWLEVAAAPAHNNSSYITPATAANMGLVPQIG